MEDTFLKNHLSCKMDWEGVLCNILGDFILSAIFPKSVSI